MKPFTSLLIATTRLWHSCVFYASGEGVRGAVGETRRPCAEVNGLRARDQGFQGGLGGGNPL